MKWYWVLPCARVYWHHYCPMRCCLTVRFRDVGHNNRPHVFRYHRDRTRPTLKGTARSSNFHDPFGGVS